MNTSYGSKKKSRCNPPDYDMQISKGYKMLNHHNDGNNWDWKGLLVDSSKYLVVQSAELARHKPELIKPLFDLANSGSGKYSQRAARIFCYLLMQNPGTYDEYLDQIIERLEYISDESIKFCFLKVFTFSPLPGDDEKLGMLADVCFAAVEAKVKRIAIKVYAIDILYRISQSVPEIKRELLDLILKYMDGAQMAFVSRGNKIAAKLRTEIRKQRFDDYK